MDSTDLVALPNVPTRDQIEALQVELQKLPPAEPVTEHHFADGMYARSVSRVAGTLVVGKVHKKEHFFVLVSGEMTVWTEAGMKRVTAPFIWVSKPGTKRVTLAHTDSTAMTVHRVSSMDLDAVERELVEDEPACLYGPGNKLLEKALEYIA